MKEVVNSLVLDLSGIMSLEKFGENLVKLKIHFLKDIFLVYGLWELSDQFVFWLNLLENSQQNRIFFALNFFKILVREFLTFCESSKKERG